MRLICIRRRRIMLLSLLRGRGLFGALLFHGMMMADGAASRGADHAVMARHVARHAADGGTGDAAGMRGDRHCQGGNGEQSVFHRSPQQIIPRLTHGGVFRFSAWLRVCVSRRLAQILEAAALGFRQHGQRDTEAQHAGRGGAQLGGEQAVP